MQLPVECPDEAIERAGLCRAIAKVPKAFMVGSGSKLVRSLRAIRSAVSGVSVTIFRCSAFAGIGVANSLSVAQFALMFSITERVQGLSEYRVNYVRLN